jgi:hypothetical protein
LQRAAGILGVAAAMALAAWVAYSVLGPSSLADGVDAVAQMAIHLLVGATLVGGFASARALTGRVRAPGR